MTSNLPPGVTESMIPGNRPEDIRFEQLYEELFNRLPSSIQDEIEKDTNRGKKLDRHFQDMIERIFTEDDLIQEMEYLDGSPTEYL
jgi:hypothetical protein